MAAVAVVVAVVGGFILVRNDGVFTYTLDDVYIHLVLARSLVTGHYGFNLIEVSSPSSSVIFPFLLVPFVWVGVGTVAPLARGQARLPTSVLVHAEYADVPRRGLGIVADVGRNIVGHADSHAGAALTALALVAIAMFALAATPPLARAPQASSTAMLVAAGCLVLLGLPYLRALVLAPSAANDVFRQQHQMATLVRHAGIRSVAVNDIGLVSWMNPGVYVLAVAGEVVAIYVRDARAADAVRPALEELSRAMPAGASLELG